jgi:hypothetical protein
MRVFSIRRIPARDIERYSPIRADFAKDRMPWHAAESTEG